jgi:hypothetical protein
LEEEEDEKRRRKGALLAETIDHGGFPIHSSLDDDDD